MGECDSDKAENMLSGAEEPPSEEEEEEQTSNTMNLPADSTSSDHHGINLVQVLDDDKQQIQNVGKEEISRVEANECCDCKQSEFIIGNHDQVLNQKEAERSSSKDESKTLKPPLKKEGMKVIIPYKDLKSKQIVVKKIEKRILITLVRSDCRVMRKTEVKTVKYKSNLHMKLVPIFKPAGTNYDRGDKNGDGDCSGDGENGSDGEDSKEEEDGRPPLDDEDEFPPLGGFKKA